MSIDTDIDELAELTARAAGFQAANNAARRIEAALVDLGVTQEAIDGALATARAETTGDVRPAVYRELLSQV